MNIITTTQSAKFIQSWHSANLPAGYAVVPSELDTSDFYTYNGFVTLAIDDETNTVTKMTPNVEAWEAWKASLPDPAIAKAKEVRAERDKLLADCDWTQCLDAPIDTATSTAYREYRQALRDVTEQEGFPNTVIWPTEPIKVKDIPDPIDTAVDVLLGGEDA